MNLWHDNQGRLRSFWRFLLGLVVAFIANFIAIGMAVPLSHNNAIQLEAIYRPLTMVFLLFGYMLLLTSADQVHKNFLSALGLGRFRGWIRQALLGIAIGAALISIAVLFIVIFGSLHKLRVNVTEHAFALAGIELFILITAAMSEELMFRSYPFQRLLEAAGAPLAVIVMSVLFGIAHGANPHASVWAMANTFLVGALLCVAYLRTSALWLPWGIHFAWNTMLGLVFGLPVSGLTSFAVLVRTRATGPRWVTGGAYGIEGSLVGTFVILLGFIPVVLMTRRAATQPADIPDVHNPFPPRELSSQHPDLAQRGEWDRPGQSDPPAARRIQEG